MRQWRARNRAKWDAYMADYRQRNRARLVEYRRAHILEIKARKHRYMARKYKAEGRYTAEEFRRLIALNDGKCVYCGVVPTGRQRLEADHILPLSRGGSNAIENIVPACHACNVRKRDRTPEEFGANINFKRMSSIPKRPAGHKECSICKRMLPYSAYWKDKHHPLGIQSNCKECNYAKHKAYLAKPGKRAMRRAAMKAWRIRRASGIE